METEQYDLVQTRMWAVRGYDLRLCDICDFFIAHINPSVASWGSAEEITTVVREKKPLFLSIEGGKKKTPLWIMGKLPHKYIYNNVDEIMDTIKAIDDGIIKINSDRWKLLKKELR
jgi:L-cysteine desulfidase